MNPRIISVSANEDFTLTLVFSNGEVGNFDMKEYLDKGVFRELQDYALFQTVRLSLGSIEWIHGQDLCPDTLYLKSQKRKSILKSITEPVVTPEMVESLKSLGKNGYDYRETEKALLEATRKMLENAGRINDEIEQTEALNEK